MPLQDINKPLTKGERSQIQTFLESDYGVKLLAQAQTEGTKQVESLDRFKGWMACLEFLKNAAEETKTQLDDQTD